MLKTAASFVLGRDSCCGVAQGYASLASLPAASLDNRFEHPTRDEKSKRFALRKAVVDFGYCRTTISYQGEGVS
jgi:hypothetical protein